MNREATGLAGVRHVTYGTLGSTNAEALTRARAGERGPLWVTARSQSAGRGRRGNAWVSPPGNLHATLMLSEPSAPPQSPQLSFVAALGAHDALSLCAPRLGPLLKVKWPNDLLLDGKKVAGILIEGEGEPVFTVAIGFGVNCVSHPGGTFHPATNLAAWLKRAAGIGEPIRVRLPESELAGRFQGLDEAGRLLLEDADGIETITAGDVFALGPR
jgi:BirA family biotin operon repressor/biotin-[acetyl-CoA-carboxylase] ligase